MDESAFVEGGECVLEEAGDAGDVGGGASEDEDGLVGVCAGEAGNLVWIPLDLGEGRPGVLLSPRHVTTALEVKLPKPTPTLSPFTLTHHLTNIDSREELVSISSMDVGWERDREWIVGGWVGGVTCLGVRTSFQLWGWEETVKAPDPHAPQRTRSFPSFSPSHTPQ